MLLIPSLIIAFTFGFVLKNKNYKLLSSVVIPIVVMIVSWIIYSMCVYNEIHPLTYYFVKYSLIGGVIGAPVGFGVCYLLKEKSGSKFNLRLITIISRSMISGIIIFFSVVGFFEFFQPEISARQRLPGKIPLLAKVIFKEDLTEVGDYYDSRAFEFDFNDFDTVEGCEIITKAKMLENDFFVRVGYPFKVFDLLEPDEEICVINYSDLVLYDGNLMEGEILITRPTGVIYISYYRI